MLLLRGATYCSVTNIKFVNGFNTCSSCEEQLCIRHAHYLVIGFNTCSSCEEQQGIPYVIFQPPLFQYMLLLRGATIPHRRVQFQLWFQYMLLLRGATGGVLYQYGTGEVSIHAPLARSNGAEVKVSMLSAGFNTCSSCEEQQMMSHFCSKFFSFNTCSSCEEQRECHGFAQKHGGFNTCSSCEEQRDFAEVFGDECLFQYMLLLRGATTLWLPSAGLRVFQYMLLLRGATHSRARERPSSLFQYMLLLRGATMERER